MEQEFWLERWRKGEIGFHQSDINPYLQRYWPQLQLAPGSRVFVPLCGKSLDMLWLYQLGHAVLGVELSPQAVEGFFTDHALAAQRRSHGHFTCWQHDDIQLLCGDFFSLTAADLAGVTAVFDRAALIALPPPLRARYVEQLRRILPPQARILLVTINYPQHEMEGPPFAVPDEEVTALYGSWRTVMPLCCADVLAEQPRFRERGLTRLQESAWLLAPAQR
ncbi:MAG: thiopurine S-methyltransferase [Gammaproteobacteria bacterium]|nr:thiopurine S-methyltransferase [Gammaproteobacteria bacterium]